MSIVAYTGLPGAGKSYSVVEHVVLPALRQQRHVVTNIPLNERELRADYKGGVLETFPVEVIAAEPEKIFEYAVPGCVLVIDECWRLWPAGLKANKVPEPFRKLLAEHRHMVDASGNAMQIVLVTQDLAQVAAFARQLVEQTFRTVKLGHLGLSRRFRLDVYQGAVTGVPPENKRLRMIGGSYKRKVYRYYNSHTMSEAGEAGANEKSVDRRFVVWRSPIWWLGVPAAVVCGTWGLTTAAAYFSGGAAADAHALSEAKRSAAAQAVPSFNAAANVETPGPLAPLQAAPRDPLYRIAGFVLGEGRSGAAAIRDREGVVHFVPAGDCWEPGDHLLHCVFDGYEVTQAWARAR